MEEKQTTQPNLGTWNNLPTEEIERKPKVQFNVNVPVEVTFTEEDPVELQGESGAYYMFHVKEKDEEKVIMTSAWTLLRPLKVRTPLKGKTLVITKKLISGKQQFVVEDKK